MYDGLAPDHAGGTSWNVRAMTHAREIAIVGNGPIEGDAAGAIDGADWVVRFNKAAGFGGPTGRRVDDLFLVNCGGQALEWLRDGAFWRSAPVAAARRVTLPVARGDAGSGLWTFARTPPDEPDGINYEHDMRRRLRRCRRPCRVRTLPETHRRRAIDALVRAGPRQTNPIWPSTGFLALYWYDRTIRPDTRLTLYGFGFTGWSGHSWARERAWVMARVRSGRMRLIGGDSAARKAA